MSDLPLQEGGLQVFKKVSRPLMCDSKLLVGVGANGHQPQSHNPLLAHAG